MTRGAVWAGVSSSDGGDGDGGGGPGSAGGGDDERGRLPRVRAGRRWTRALIGVGLVAALAAGCTGTDPEPNPSPTPTAESPEPTTTPSPDAVQAPVRPPEMDRADEAGAVAAAGYFMEMFSYVMQTGDIAGWDLLSGQSCEFCANTRKDVVAVYDAGGSFDGGEMTLGDVAVVGIDPTLGYFTVGVHYSVARGAEIAAGGSVVQEVAQEDGYATLDVILADRGWVLIELRATQEPTS